MAFDTFSSNRKTFLSWEVYGHEFFSERVSPGTPLFVQPDFFKSPAVNVFAEISPSAKKWMVCGQTKLFNREITDSNLEYNHSI